MKCKVEKAKKECQCESCKFRRSMELMSATMQVQQAIFKATYKLLVEDSQKLSTTEEKE